MSGLILWLCGCRGRSGHQCGVGEEGGGAGFCAPGCCIACLRIEKMNPRIAQPMAMPSRYMPSRSRKAEVEAGGFIGA